MDGQVVWKLLEGRLAPLHQSYVELAAFAAILLLAAAAVSVRRHRQFWRHVIQLASMALFFCVVTSCLGVFGLIRNAYAGITLIGKDSLTAFYLLGLTAAILAVACHFGAVFCGWICPTGALQEFVAWLRKPFERTHVLQYMRISRLRPAAILALYAVYLALVYRIFSRQRPMLEDAAVLWGSSLLIILLFATGRAEADLPLRRLRYVSLALIVGFTAIGIPVFSPVHFVFTNVHDWASSLSTLVVVAATLVVMRAWCRYLCPFGLLCGLAAKAARFQIRRNERCTGCNVCGRECDTGVIDRGSIDLSGCIACMRCIDVCPESALELVDIDAETAKATQQAPPALRTPHSALLLCVLCILCGERCAEAGTPLAEWRCFRGHANNSAFVGLAAPLSGQPHDWTFKPRDIVWTQEAGVPVWTSPAASVVAGRAVVIVGSYDRNVYCLDAADGRELWRFPTGGPISSTPAIASAGGRMLVWAPSMDRTLYCLDAEDGRKLWGCQVYSWRHTVGRAFLSSPVILDVDGRRRAIFCSWVHDTSPARRIESTEARCLDAETGHLDWRVEFATSRPTNPVAGDADGLKVYVGCDDGNLYCLDAANGRTLWTDKSKMPIRSSPAFTALDGRPMVIFGNRFGELRALDGRDGSILWVLKTANWIDCSPVVVEVGGAPAVLFGGFDRHFRALRLGNHEPLWAPFPTHGEIDGSPAYLPAGEGAAVFTSGDDQLHALAAGRRKELWRLSPGAFLWEYRGLGETQWASPIAAEVNGVPMVYLPYYDGVVHAYRFERTGAAAIDRTDPAYGLQMLQNIALSAIFTLADIWMVRRRSG